MATAKLAINTTYDVIGELGLYTLQPDLSATSCTRANFDALKIIMTSEMRPTSYACTASGLSPNCTSVSSYDNSTETIVVNILSNTALNPSFALVNPYKTVAFTSLDSFYIVGMASGSESVRFSAVTPVDADGTTLTGNFVTETAIDSTVTSVPGENIVAASYTITFTSTQYISTSAILKVVLPISSGISVTSTPVVSSTVKVGGVGYTKSPSVSYASGTIAISDLVPAGVEPGATLEFTISSGITNPTYVGTYKWEVHVVYSDGTLGAYKTDIASVLDQVASLSNGAVTLGNYVNVVATTYIFAFSFVRALPVTGITEYQIAVTIPTGLTCQPDTLLTTNESLTTFSAGTLSGTRQYVYNVTLVQSPINAYTSIGFTMACTNFETTAPKTFTVALKFPEKTASTVVAWPITAQTTIGRPLTLVTSTVDNSYPGQDIDTYTLAFSRDSTVGIKRIEISPGALLTQNLDSATSSSPNITISGYLATAFGANYTSNKHLQINFTTTTTGTSFAMTIEGLNNPNRTNETSSIGIRTYTSDGYIIDEMLTGTIQIAVTCNYPCKTCLNSSLPDYCLTCIDTYTYNSDTKQCLHNYIVCPEKYYPDSLNSSCLPCDKSCQTCSGSSSSQCTSCDVDNRLRLRFFHAGECMLTCPKNYRHNYQDNTCDEIVGTPIVMIESYISTACIAVGAILVVVSAFVAKAGAFSLFCSCYSLLSICELVTRVLLFISLFEDLRYVSNVAISISIMLGTHALFWNYKFFNFDPMTRMKSFEPVYTAHRVSIAIVELLSVCAGSNTMLLLASGLLRLPALSHGLSQHPIFRVFVFKAAWGPALFNACQAILAFSNLFLYSDKSAAFVLSIISLVLSVVLVALYITEVFVLRPVRKHLNFLMMRALQRKEVKTEGEVQRIRLLRGGVRPSRGEVY